MSCKTEEGAASEPGWAGQGRVVLPPRRALTSTGLGLRRAGSRRASTPSQARSASASAPWGCESSTMRRGVSCCEKPGSSWLLPPRSMQDATGREPGRALRRPRLAQPSRTSRRRHLAARRLAPRCYRGDAGGARAPGPGGTGTGTAPQRERRRAGSRAARSASPRELRRDKEPRVFHPRSSLRGECCDLAHMAGHRTAEIRPGRRVRAGKCPRGALPIPFSSEVQNSLVLGLRHGPSAAYHRVRPFLDITGE